MRVQITSVTIGSRSITTAVKDVPMENWEVAEIRSTITVSFSFPDSPHLSPHTMTFDWPVTNEKIKAAIKTYSDSLDITPPVENAIKETLALSTSEIFDTEDV